MELLLKFTLYICMIKIIVGGVLVTNEERTIVCKNTIDTR